MRQDKLNGPLHCASTTAAGATTALAATCATFAGCVGRLAGTAATASAGATNLEAVV